MSKKKSRSRVSDKLWIHVEVLENGVPMAQSSKRARRGLVLAISSKGKDALALPHFPLPDGRYQFLQWENGKARLTVDQLWEGFCTASAAVVTFAREGGKEREADLVKGDYASIGNGILRIMIKVDAHPPKRKREGLPSFLKKKDRASFMGHFFPGREERFALAGAVVLASFVIGGLTFGLSIRPYFKPLTVTDIRDEYVLPFVSPEHLRNAPEALQTNIDRTQLTRNTVFFYQSLTAMLMGWANLDARFLFPTSITLYNSLHAAVKESARKKLRQQKDSDGVQAEEERQAVMALPAAVGESLGGSMLRVIDKIGIMHEALGIDLAAKRALVKEFPKDPVYDFEEYHNLNGAKSHAMEELSKAVTRSFGNVSDEELMYAEAEALARRAASVQKRLATRAHSTKTLNASAAEPLAMLDGTRYATYVDDIDFLIADEKLYRLEASEYGPRRRAPKVKEPLVGEIEPGLIERFIRQNRFQLQLCYELALRRNEGAAGTMEWQWRIDSRGLISDVALVASAIKDQKMITCVRDKIGAWRFPRPRRGSVEVRYPFDFNPSRG